MPSITNNYAKNNFQSYTDQARFTKISRNSSQVAYQPQYGGITESDFINGQYNIAKEDPGLGWSFQ